MAKETPVENVPAAEWEHWIAEHDGLLLDVREPKEWAGGTLPGAKLMAMSAIEEEWTELDPDTPTLVVCRSGRRSMMVAAALARAGFTEVANLAGGMKKLGLAD